ncbi:MAG: hypothetical protein LBE16_02130 [Clostridiales Family XIII bacterium]|jgi:hypothetical protein|nr:hypothetical protein [Clostridiales Family XIII bacterium]
MRVSSRNRLAPIPALRGSGGVSGGSASGELRCRVTRRQIGDKPPGKPDWDKIPTKKEIPLREDEWERLIERSAVKDAVHGRAMSGQSESLLVDYISQRSPDRRRMYEILFNRYGDKLEAYNAGDGSNMRNVNGMWEYDLTAGEARLVEGFMNIYAPAFETARADRLAGRRLSREV